MYNTEEGQRSQLARRHVEKSPRGFPAKFGSCRAHPAQDKAGLRQLSSAGAATPWTFCQPIPVVFRFMVCGFNFPIFGKGEQSANKFRKSQIRKFSGLKALTNENRGGLKEVSFDRSPFKLFTLRFSNKSVEAPSCERPKTAPRTLFLLFANNN